MNRIQVAAVAAALLACPAAASGQSPLDSARDGRPLDIRTVDPESYQVVAVRLPDGQAPAVDGRLLNYDWDAVWESRTSVDDNGWYAELAVPLSQLRFNGGPGESVWGISVGDRRSRSS